MYSQYVRYERRGDRVVPVRVMKQWVTNEVAQHDNRKAPKAVRKFMAVRVSELRMGRMPREEALDAEGKPVAWQSSSRVESRERLTTLWQRGDEACEPVVREAGYDQHWLPLGTPPFVGDAHGWTLDNGNGWRPEEES